MTFDNSHIPTTNKVNLTKDVETGEKLLNQYKLISKLGNGHNGKVYLGQSIENDEFYAIKEISKVSKISILNKDPDNQINKINNEINIMKLIIKHPKILRLYEILNDLKFNKIFLILEYCPNGELKFGDSINYSLKFLRMIIRDVVLGLEYLNGIGIIHRDIKPSNLLISNDNFIKISDFGISINKFHDSKFEKKLSNFGTPAFSPPELCNGSNYNKIDGKIDVWSLGVTIYCLYFGKLPFNGNNEYELFNEIINNEPIIPESQDEEIIQLNDLLYKMLNKNPLKRYSIHDIKSHKFLISDLDTESRLQFLKFNEYYLFKRETNLSNFAKTSSTTTLAKFKSIFIRKSSISKDQDNERPQLDPLASTASLPVSESDEVDSPKRLAITQPNSLVSTAPTSRSSSPPLPNFHINRSQTPALTSVTSSSFLKRPPLRSAQSQIASSTNSLNLNSLLRSKKDVPNYLDDSTFFQSVDSELSSSDSESDESDEDGMLYNDVEDTLSIRIGPKRQTSSLAVKTMHDYLGI